MVILDMKYPKNCAECDLCYKDDLCNVDGTYAIGDIYSKPSWCPIKGEIPDHHGRLIDADKLHLHEKDVKQGNITWLMDVYTKEEIDNAPTVIERM